MKGSVLTLFFLSFFTMLAKLILPKGEQSPLFSPLKFLISLMLIITVFSPFFNFESMANTPLPSIDDSEINVEEVNQSILQKSANGMQKTAEAAFPSANFSLKIDANEEYVPTCIRVFSESESTGTEIARFLEKNYQILSVWEGTSE